MTHNLKLCANISLLFNEYPLTDRLAAAADQGFNAVEIQFPYEAPLTDLQQAQQRHQLQIPLINVPAGDLMQGGEGLASSPKQRDAFKRAVDECLVYADGLNVACVNVLAGRCMDEASKERYYDTFLHNLDYAADQLASIGVRALFEAINTCDMPNFLIHSVKHMQQVLKDLNHRNLAMQYDIYHMARMNEPVALQLDNLLDDIGHIQFADTPHRHEPGTGELDFHDLIERLARQNYSGWLGAEYKPSDKTDKTLQWIETLGFKTT
jgi:hydroxypyruvate isomerase